MAKVEKEIFRQSENKPLVWKRFIDDVFSLWNISAGKIEETLILSHSATVSIEHYADVLTQVDVLDRAAR